MVYSDRLSIVHGYKDFEEELTNKRSLSRVSKVSKYEKDETVGRSRKDVRKKSKQGSEDTTYEVEELMEKVDVLFLGGGMIFTFYKAQGYAVEGQVSSQNNNRSLASEDLEYESILATGEPNFEIVWPNDEWDAIALNYTSGTTSRPKGVIYSHRGAYLNSLASVLLVEMTSMPVYLWTLPMFHCNGWCLTWAVAAQGGTNICLRSVTAEGIFSSIVEHQVTHLASAPTVFNMIINASPSVQRPLPRTVNMITAAVPPPPQVLLKMKELGFNVTHGYGLTETYGPATFCAWKPEWNSLSANEQAKIQARQGVNHLVLEEVDVKDSESMKSVPPDAKTMGEVMIRGNTVMNGYLKDVKATEDAFKGGWFRSGDLAVKHPDGYIVLKDRLKDIIISGGENISTIEVESVIFSHPAVLEAAVVGGPDDHWGETACAFVKLKNGCNASANDIIKHCRDHLPHYMTPRTVIFDD
ncbi:hypothetical protein K7X08_020866 [Anisodus acutangulus]|uniref:4-coumarate--CoA ligase n=1 Tax=Anisodus acutangulus TaxID=402998 RepID=A0A9Q1MUB6_9SOLA|nr:hypothetical protein K7X08_020866 [Anisodus acutangulus]